MIEQLEDYVDVLKYIYPNLISSSFLIILMVMTISSPMFFQLTK